jgi:hypothetical protein
MSEESTLGLEREKSIIDNMKVFAASDGIPYIHMHAYIKWAHMFDIHVFSMYMSTKQKHALHMYKHIYV